MEIVLQTVLLAITLKVIILILVLHALAHNALHVFMELITVVVALKDIILTLQEQVALQLIQHHVTGHVLLGINHKFISQDNKYAGKTTALIALKMLIMLIYLTYMHTANIGKLITTILIVAMQLNIIKHGLI